MNNDNDWVEKYRPKQLDDLILPENAAPFLADLLTNKDTPCGALLLHSKEPGTGKSSFVDVLGMRDDLTVEDIISAGTGVSELDRMRTLIMFSSCNTKTLFVIDEVSEASLPFRQGLRKLMDDTRASAYYIFTDNNQPKLVKENPAVFNDERADSVHFKIPSPKQYTDRLMFILMSEGLTYEEAELGVTTIYKSAYPSFRKGIKYIRTYALNNKLGPFNNTASAVTQEEI